MAHQIPNTFSLSFERKNMHIEMFHYSFNTESSDNIILVPTQGSNLCITWTYHLTLLKTFNIYCPHVLNFMLTDSLA